MYLRMILFTFTYLPLFFQLVSAFSWAAHVIWSHAFHLQSKWEPSLKDLHWEYFLLYDFFLNQQARLIFNRLTGRILTVPNHSLNSLKNKSALSYTTDIKIVQIIWPCGFYGNFWVKNLTKVNVYSIALWTLVYCLDSIF